METGIKVNSLTDRYKDMESSHWQPARNLLERGLTARSTVSGPSMRKKAAFMKENSTKVKEKVMGHISLKMG
jgi:hypothetical protein